MDYKELLKKARECAPNLAIETERFEIPNVKSHVQGNTTIISNFSQIADYLHRDADHLLKYVLRKLATPGEIKKTGSAIIRSKVPSTRINERIKEYVKEFVVCGECRKHDSTLIKQENKTILKCLACGAQRFVEKIN